MKRWIPRILVCLILLTGGAILLVGAIWYFFVLDFDPEWREIGTAQVDWPGGASISDLFADPSRTFYGGIIVGGPTKPVTRVASGTFILIGDSRRVVTLWQLDAPGDVDGALVPAMHLELSHLIKNNHGSIMPDGGTPPIYCDLNQQQAEYVLEHGVPRSLIDAILRAGDTTGWQPLPFAEDAGRSIDRTKILWIAPGPHFPQ